MLAIASTKLSYLAVIILRDTFTIIIRKGYSCLNRDIQSSAWTYLRKV
jgi:hypothetical protein